MVDVKSARNLDKAAKAPYVQVMLRPSKHKEQTEEAKGTVDGACSWDSATNRMFFDYENQVQCALTIAP